MTDRLDPHARDEQVARLFSVIFDPGDLVEVRTIGPGQDIRQDWMEWTGDAGDLRGILDAVEPLVDRQHGLYFGANPRKTRGGRAEHVALARCIFVDFDTGADGSAGCSKQDALQRVEDAGLPWPSAVVESGGGVHCYWRLAEPMLDLAAWSSIQRAVIRKLQSDKVVHDAPRVMRLPGMLNAKRGRLALVVEASDLRVYDLAEFDAVVREAEQRATDMQERVAAVEVKPGGMSAMTRGLVEQGRLLNGGGRRQSLFTAACDLKAHGWNERDAVDLLLPVGQRLGLAGDEIDDLRRQFHNAFKQERAPYAFDRPQQDPQQEKRESPLPTLDEQLQAFTAFRSRNAGRRFVGLQTGFDRLDDMLSGLSGLSIIAAAPGAGKTSLTLQAGLQILNRNPDALFMFMSCEMRAIDMTGRLLTMSTGLDLRRLLLPGQSTAAADDAVIEKAASEMHHISRRVRMVPPDLIIEASSRGDLAGWMLRRTLEAMEETETREVVLVLDNMQQAPFASTRHDGMFTTDIERDRYSIESMMRLQHGLASQAERASTIVVSEVSKAAMKEGSADMTAVIGSIRSVYKADTVMVMAPADRGSDKKPDRLFAPLSDKPGKPDFGKRCVDLVVTKARAPGERGRLLFAFDHRLHKMEQFHEALAVRVPSGEEWA